jgi:thiol-disulfide isomerase/thioredoxin
MNKVTSRVLSASAFCLSVLLLTSCASLDPVPISAEPEPSMSQSPTAAESPSATAGNYIPYESFVTSGDEYSDSNVVLFFNAVWCSTCKQARDNFEASLSEIPEDLTIVVVDFDNALELRKQYGVTVQHTFIQIDSEGEALAKWSGSISVAEIVDQLI